jgi:hypothetical protein
MKTRNDQEVYNLASVLFKWLLLIAAVILGGKVLLKDSQGFRNSARQFLRNPIRHGKTIASEGNFLFKKIQQFRVMVKSYLNQTKT